MAKRRTAAVPETAAVTKIPTGIQGFDEITGGGLPRNRIALVCGGPGSGKTLFSMEFIVHGAMDYDEPGLFVAFEETAEELGRNVASLGFDLQDLVARKKLVVDHVRIERSEIQETGDYDLEGLFVRLDYLIKSVGAKRVVLDTLEALFSGFSNELILRAELRRLFRWLKERGVTTMVTAEKGDGQLTRHGLEEYVSDCVIVLDHLLCETTATRRLRVVKYRGSQHGTNEYPFLIGKRGISILPVTSLELRYGVSSARISSGVPGMDAMFSGQGFYRGSSVLVSGTAGTGKSSFAATFTDAACRRGETVLYLALEESQAQIIRNMRSIGLDLEPWVKQGRLHFHTARPTLYGLEMHLVTIHDLVNQVQPDVVVFDPISNLISVGNSAEVKAMLTRLIDYLKLKQVTTLFTNLLSDPEHLEATEIGVSSLMDTWIVFRDMESGGERNRVIHIIKSRGMAHSNQLREFLITPQGLELREAYIGRGQVYTGSARLIQEAADTAEAARQRQERERRQRDGERQRRVIEAQIAVLQTQLEAADDDSRQRADEEQQSEQEQNRYQDQLAAMRRVNGTRPTAPVKKPARRR